MLVYDDRKEDKNMARTCPSCGRTIYSDTAICPYCKKPFGNSVNPPSVDEARRGLKILSFFIPPAAFVLFCVYLDSQPMAAKAYGLWGIAGALIIPLAIFIVSCSLTGAAMWSIRYW